MTACANSRVLGEEPVTRVHRVRAGPAATSISLSMRRYVSAAVSPPSAYASSASLGVQRVAVGVGVDRDAGEARVAAGADDADGDLAPVGDEHLAHVVPPDPAVAAPSSRGRAAPPSRSLLTGMISARLARRTGE